MSDIYLVTPPDKLFNKNYSVLLLYPSDELKRQVQTLLEAKTDSINVYPVSYTHLTLPTNREV